MTHKKCDPFMAFAVLLFSILAMTTTAAAPLCCQGHAFAERQRCRPGVKQGTIFNEIRI